MSTNKFSKYVVENIVTGTQIRSIVPAGALDSAGVIELIDSDYVAARTPAANGFDSSDVIGIVDSDYVQSRVTLDGVGIDSATAQSIANSEILSTVDAAYVQARETAQDFAYSSLTGAPTTLSSFTNDTNYITAADIPATVDSDYIAARTPAANGGGLDSAAVSALIDSDLAGTSSVPGQFLVGTTASRVAIGNGAAATYVGTIAIGGDAGKYVSGGSHSIAIGADALGGASGGGGQSHYNIAIGDAAMSNLSSAAYEITAIGKSAAKTDAGNYSVAIGSGAGQSNLGSNSIAVGANTSATGSNSIAVGAGGGFGGAQANANNSIVLSATGDTNTVSTQYGIDIRTSAAGSLTYDTTNDWVFGATVNATAFVGDGSGLTGLPSGGGLDSAGVQGIVDDNITGGILSVQIGDGASAISTALQQVVIGPTASSNGQFNVAIGRNAKVQSSRAAGTAVGNDARVGSSTGGNNGVAIGTNAIVEMDAGTAVGPNAYVKNGSNATAVGMQANAWATSALALGHGANATFEDAIAVGRAAVSSQADTIAMGTSSVASGSSSVAIGRESKGTGSNSIAIGFGAGNTTGGDNSVLIGTSAGQSAHQRLNVVAVGTNAQLENDANVSSSVAVGYEAGKTRQESSTVAVGASAGVTDQLNSATAVGFQAGNTSQGGSSVAIGRDAAFTGQATNSVAIGRAAGYENQGTRSIAIGRQAGAANQGANNIILNATSAALNRTDQFGIDIRTSAAGSLTYDTTNDWTFGATVNAPAFVGDGSGLTGLPSGGGLDSAATLDLIGFQNTTAGSSSIQITPDTSTKNGDNNNIIIGHGVSDLAGIGPNSVALGYDVGAQNSGISLGYKAGAGSQSTNTGGIFIGYQTNYFGNSNPANYAIAIGHEAGAVYPGVGSVALGKSAGAGSSGDYTVAIGYKANDTSSFENTIMIKADGSSSYNSTAQFGIDIRTSAAGSLTYDTTNDWTFGAGVTMTDLTASGATVIFSNLPTVDPVNAGQLWNSAGTLKVSAG